MRKLENTTPKVPLTVPQHATPGRAVVNTPARPSQTRSVSPNDQFRADELEVLARRSVPSSKIHFVVHPGMAEIQAFAVDQGWIKKGATQLTIAGQELRWSIDNWKSTNTLRSSEVPSPFVNGFISLPNVPKGTPVKFAIMVRVASHLPSDIAGYQDRGDTWLNNGGQDYTQVTG